MEPFAHRDHRGVDEPEPEVGVALLELGGPHDVRLGDRLEAVRAGGEVLDERPPHRNVQTRADPVVDLHQRGGGHHERLPQVAHELDATGVVGVVAFSRARIGPASSTSAISRGSHRGPGWPHPGPRSWTGQDRPGRPRSAGGDRRAAPRPGGPPLPAAPGTGARRGDAPRPEGRQGRRRRWSRWCGGQACIGC